MSAGLLTRPRHALSGSAPSPVRPTDPGRAHASGPAPFRILAAGEVFTGEGVLTHELGLAGGIARGVGDLTSHGVDVDLVRGGAKHVLHWGGGPAERDLRRFDAVVVQLDDTVLRQRTDFRTKVPALLQELRARVNSRTALIAVLRAEQLDRIRCTAAEVAEWLPAAARLAILPASGGRSADAYTDWGYGIARVAVEGLSFPRHWADPIDVLHEPSRERAVRALLPADEHWNATFQRLVELAQSTYGTAAAALGVVTGSTVDYTARTSLTVPASLPRAETLCTEVLRRHGGLIVADAVADARFSDLPVVADGSVRFYAGYRVCNPDGQPVASLCVFDAAPRTVTSYDIVPLRDFAIAAERQLWKLTTRQRRCAATRARRDRIRDPRSYHRVPAVAGAAGGGVARCVRRTGSGRSSPSCRHPR